MDASWRPKPVPALLAHIWVWFCELDRTRQRTSDGQPLSISYQEIKAWAELTGRTPSPFEVETIHALDATFFRVKNTPTEEVEQGPQSIKQMAETLRGFARTNNEIAFEKKPLISPERETKK